ncbi:oligosaccharide flippase family protein [Phocaeicola sp. KGMB11183]|uniref:Oligosaccharide flippase family protein n=1 Tax=Phocaeicola acetigenes TaxID=3016083 RepID=A0ABT4PHC9_9BACT|nr:oligosaccharide flippase family protein [Phocaeicola sp. KGMB11183]MCZ8372445.1 oligosaccharide flippase family protein [Phocaeicola sp. KGMB11183]
MTNTAENNKRIAKNTMLLYVRMLFIIIIGLYTSRVVLQTLGVNDYGIYNVVGGIVAMLAFLNSAMTAASQRFISFELGTKNFQKLKNVFCTSVTIHLVIAGIIFIIAETVGLWFLNTHMNIAADRMTAANWVYQCSIFTFMITVISVPYNACIVAHEHMKTFAYISIVEVGLKLVIVYLLLILPADKLITYAILILSVSLIIRAIYGIYCKKNFEECTYQFNFDKKLFKEMFAFASWSIIGNLGFSLKDQGSNIILNLFCGTTINAARGVALQVNGIICNFSNNFIMALNPQITKQYAAGNLQESIQLVYTGCRYSFYLLSIISIPVIVNLDYLLHLWLGTVPPYTTEFLFLALIAALINSMAGPLVTAMQATGKIKNFQIIICIIMMCELPLTYIILKLGYKPYMAMIPSIIVITIGLLARLLLLKQLIKSYSISYFSLHIILKNILIVSGCTTLAIFIHGYFGKISFANFILTSFLAFVITIIGIYIFGITCQEKKIINNKIKAIF